MKPSNYQEALDRIYCTLESIDRRKAYNFLYELIEKEVAKKPLYVKYDNGLSWQCPNCSVGYRNEKDKRNRCDCCGQLIDWSNDE